MTCLYTFLFAVPVGIVLAGAGIIIAKSREHWRNKGE